MVVHANCVGSNRLRWCRRRTSCRRCHCHLVACWVWTIAMFTTSLSARRTVGAVTVLRRRLGLCFVAPRSFAKPRWASSTSLEIEKIHSWLSAAWSVSKKAASIRNKTFKKSKKLCNDSFRKRKSKILTKKYCCAKESDDDFNKNKTKKKVC